MITTGTYEVPCMQKLLRYASSSRENTNSPSLPLAVTTRATCRKRFNRDQGVLNLALTFGVRDSSSKGKGHHHLLKLSELGRGGGGGVGTKCATKYDFPECTSPLPGRSWTSVVPVCKSSPQVSATIPLPSAHMRYTWGGVIKYVAAGKWNPENSETKQDNNSRSEG